jgi:hypothetical protein
MGSIVVVRGVCIKERLYRSVLNVSEGVKVRYRCLDEAGVEGSRYGRAGGWLVIANACALI